MVKKQKKEVDYGHPPVIELVLGIQFDRIPGFSSCHLGTLQAAFAKSGYSEIEEHHPLESTYETFGPQPLFFPGFGFATVTDFVPRIWFKTADGAFIVQFQPNKLICNWRKNSETAEYPRYEALQERFIEAFAIICDTLKKINLAKPQCNQAEISYINHITSADYNDVWQNPSRSISALNPFPVSSSEHIEDSNFQIRYILQSDGKPFARLLVLGQPLVALDQQKIFGLTLSVKGIPSGKDIEAALNFFYVGHDTIVRKFDQLATAEAKKKWGRTS